MRIGQSIKLIRTAQGVTQKELAAEAPCSANYLSLVERAERTPSIEFVEKIGKALGVPAGHIFALADDESRIEDPVKRELFARLRQLALMLSEDIE
jgi:transcriptional regulator with XRE-family HTH domain